MDRSGRRGGVAPPAWRSGDWSNRIVFSLRLLCCSRRLILSLRRVRRVAWGGVVSWTVAWPPFGLLEPDQLKLGHSP